MKNFSIINQRFSYGCGSENEIKHTILKKHFSMPAVSDESKHVKASIFNKKAIIKIKQSISCRGSTWVPNIK